MLADASFARRPGAALEPLAGHGAHLVRGSATAPRRPRPGRRALRGDLRCRGRAGQHRRRRVFGEAELALLAMDRGRWAEAAEHVEVALATVEEYRLHDYAMQPARLRGCGPARTAPRRPEGGRPAARAGDASPSFVHRRFAVSSRCARGCNSPRCTRRSRTRRRHVTSCERSTTSCCTGRLWECSSTRSRSSARSSLEHAQRTAAGGTPLTPAELRLLPYLQTHLTFRRDRPSDSSCPATPSAPKSARSTENWASPHAATRCSRRRRSVCSAGSRSPARRRARTHRSVSYPSAIASFGAAATTRGSPTTGMTPTSTSTISAAVAPASSRHRPAPRRTARRHRPRPTRRGGPAPTSSDPAHRTRRRSVGAVLHEACVVDGQTPQPLRVVQGRSVPPRPKRPARSPRLHHAPAGQVSGPAEDAAQPIGRQYSAVRITQVR